MRNRTRSDLEKHEPTTEVGAPPSLGVDGSVVKRSLQRNGYASFSAADVLPPDVSRASLESLRRQSRNLPSDPYGRGHNRSRRYGQAVLIPSTGSIEWLGSVKGEHGELATVYLQDAHYNPEARGVDRLFPALHPETRANPLVRSLVEHDFGVTWWPSHIARMPVLVGVHLIRLYSEGATPGVISPDTLHQDGEPFTFVHLIEHNNVAGGVTTVAPPKYAGNVPDEVPADEVLAKFELREPLESYGVADDKVSHHVSGVAALGPGSAERSVLLIDFTPLLPAIPRQITLNVS